MNPLILMGAVLGVGLAGAAALLLRLLARCRRFVAEPVPEINFSWQGFPLHRLLDNVDVDYLRGRGFDDRALRKFRNHRRRIYHLYLRSLLDDFNQVQDAIKIVIVRARKDRADLAAELATQRLVFYQNLMKAEAGLMANACGLNYVPAIDLLEPLLAVRAELERLTTPA